MPSRCWDHLCRCELLLSRARSSIILERASITSFGRWPVRIRCRILGATFPVCATPEKYEAAVKNGIIKGISAPERHLMEALQPYHTTDPANSILQLLHDLDIEDKHRLLVVVGHTLVLGKSITITRNDNPGPGFGIELPSTATMQYQWAIEHGIQTHWVPLRGTPGPEFQMEVSSRLDIAFEQVGTTRRAPLEFPILIQCHSWTENTLHQFDDQVVGLR